MYVTCQSGFIGYTITLSAVTRQGVYTGYVKVPPHISGIPLDGGHPALDFVNTLHSWEHPDPGDYFQSGADVAAWMQRRGLVTPRIANRFAALPGPRRAALLRAARRLRSRLHRLFAPIAHHRRPPAPELVWLNRELARLARFRRLVPQQARFAWTACPDPATPDSLLAPVVFAAGELLADDRLGRVKACPPPDGCGWLFLDTSRNGRRTWCSMQTCGNVAKVRRYRARHGA
jgi:predicted RNA-binding Zn ribbon-like protein